MTKEKKHTEEIFMNNHTSKMNNSNNFKRPEALRLADYFDYHGFFDSDRKAASELRRLYAEVDRLSYRLAYPDNFVKEPEQEPVAWMNPMNGVIIDAKKKTQIGEGKGYPNFSVPCYTAIQRKPLTAEEAGAMYNTFLRNGGAIIKFVRAIEEAHGIYGEEKRETH